MKVYLDDERPTPEGWHRVYVEPDLLEKLRKEAGLLDREVQHG